MSFPTTPPPNTQPYTTAQGILDLLTNGESKSNISTKYESISGTIGDGGSDISISLGDITTGYNINILNKTTDTVLIAKLNDIANDQIKAINDTTLGTIGIDLTGQKFTSLYLSNSSGESINYEIVIQGE